MQGDAVITQGATILNQINCASCHKSEFKTVYSPMKCFQIKPLLHTDLLLYDMGCGLDDGYTQNL